MEVSIAIYLLDEEGWLPSTPTYHLRSPIEQRGERFFVMADSERIDLVPGVFPQTKWGCYGLRYYEMTLVAGGEQWGEICARQRIWSRAS